ncbi:MAG: TIGR04552 family protein, partial [Polyangiales bacterium]
MTIPELRGLDEFSLADLEAIRVLLRGGSVVDWHRLNFADEQEAEAFVRAQEIDPHDPSDAARVLQ